MILILVECYSLSSKCGDDLPNVPESQIRIKDFFFGGGADYQKLKQYKKINQNYRINAKRRFSLLPSVLKYEWMLGLAFLTLIAGSQIKKGWVFPKNGIAVLGQALIHITVELSSSWNTTEVCNILGFQRVLVLLNEAKGRVTW